MDDICIERECGIDYETLVAWFDTRELGACKVDITREEPRRLSASFTLPRNHLRMEGPADEVEALYHAFELRFISAGG